jgi:deferrochelatase/peroxidase EfeB
VFDGRYEPAVEAKLVNGRGKLMPDQTWKPIATGEFLLGHADESQELPPVAPPWELTRNGSFMVYRKLHQNVASFVGYIAEQARTFAAIMGLSEEAARETLMAKLLGRWRDGIPLIVAATYDEWQAVHDKWSDIPAIDAMGEGRTAEQQARLDAYRQMLTDFKYGDDKGGIRCPYGAHLRRMNTRDMLDPLLNAADPAERTGSALNKRRHILRRGLPYGTSDLANPNDEGEHGVIFMAVCASLSRQFEFVQQQWAQYGLDFDVGNDTCPIIGLHDKNTKFVIAADPQGDKPPFICANLPQFVTTRGGDYFFVPGLNGLRMIAEGSVDPT